MGVVRQDHAIRPADLRAGPSHQSQVCLAFPRGQVKRRAEQRRLLKTASLLRAIVKNSTLQIARGEVYAHKLSYLIYRKPYGAHMRVFELHWCFTADIFEDL